MYEAGNKGPRKTFRLPPGAPVLCYACARPPAHLRGPSPKGKRRNKKKEKKGKEERRCTKALDAESLNMAPSRARPPTSQPSRPASIRT